MMDQYQNPYNSNPYTPPNYIYTKPNHMETAALVLGIVSLVTACCGGGFIFGGMAILFALLSRGGKMTMSSKSKIGFILGLVSVIATIVVLIYIGISLYTWFTNGGFEQLMQEMIADGTLEQTLREVCEIYGLDFETVYGDLFP